MKTFNQFLEEAEKEEEQETKESKKPRPAKKARKPIRRGINQDRSNHQLFGHQS